MRGLSCVGFSTGSSVKFIVCRLKVMAGVDVAACVIGFPVFVSLSLLWWCSRCDIHVATTGAFVVLVFFV